MPLRSSGSGRIIASFEQIAPVAAAQVVGRPCRQFGPMACGRTTGTQGYRTAMRSPFRRALAVALFAGLTIGASAAAAGAGDTPDTGTSPSGRVKHFHFEYGPIDIEPGQNLIETNRTLIPQPKIDGWIVGFEPNLRMPNGKVPPVDQIHLHHGVWATGNRFDKTSPPLPERFLGVGEEKTQLHFPPGYGYPYRTGDFWWLNYMIHNLTAQPYQVSITYDIDMIPADDPPPGGIKDVHPIWMDVQNGSIYPVFDVIKGSGTNGRFTYPDDAVDPYAGGKVKNQWVVDRPGVLVHTFGHLHPGGLSVDFDLTRGAETAHLFSSTAKYYEPAGAVSWDVSMTATRPDWAVAVEPGDVLSVRATYDTSRASWYESMGLGVVWMYDGPGGKDPFTTKVDGKGVLTHGHLPENSNHGGKRTTLADPRKVADGTPTSIVNIADFLYGDSDLTARKPVPTVQQGQSITFDNYDAEGEKVWHSITSCKAPCTATTGIAYPLADGPVAFDSGQLGEYGPPTAGRVTWQTPADLAPGTYTYFCRIHPFMRGAFRVVSVG
jgi:plastocyanin